MEIARGSLEGAWPKSKRTAGDCNGPFIFLCYESRMRNDLLGKMGLAALILFAPGGFILGAAIAADHYRKKRK